MDKLLMVTLACNCNANLGICGIGGNTLIDFINVDCGNPTHYMRTCQHGILICVVRGICSSSDITSVFWKYGQVCRPM
mgnify:CR=1 FL=1